jgi:hypothetical protein
MRLRISASLSFALLVLLSACQRQAATEGPALSEVNLVTTETMTGPRTIGEAGAPFTVLRAADTRKGLAEGTVLSARSLKGKQFLRALAEPDASRSAEAEAEEPTAEGELDRSGSLVIGFPTGLLGEAQIFGGVITKLSKADDETLGRLKLIDLTPLHVRPVVAANSDETFSLALVGCASGCTETTAPSRLIDLPIVGVKEAEKTLLVDLATLGEELNLVQMMDPAGEYTKLKTKSSKVVLADYSVSTLVFDVDVTMVPIDAAAPQNEVTFTVRWYMRLGSVFHTEFTSRPEAPGVGFFMTERTKTPKIHRFSLTPLIPGQAPVHYYIKNVPEAHKAAFKGAFEQWNETLKAEVGGPLIRYEFIDATDPRAKLLVAGDPRYNIVEWDLDNLAPYGGLGPSIANQHTGEILTANVLVQGPKIVELYTNWFKVGQTAESLRSRGLVAEASELLRDHAREVQRDLRRLEAAPKLDMSLGKLRLRVPAQMPQFEDPLFKRDDFELLPPQMTYDTYMDGYFQELVAHELGHNLGLRHNFRGNLISATPNALGKVSNSIMEYLGRGFRYLNRISAYDKMAIAYGYNGKTPTVLTSFCTDENVAGIKEKGNSPECSRDDATSDPFSFFEERLKRVVSLAANPGVTTASTWTLEDLEAPLTVAVTGMGLYASASAATAKNWTNFFTGNGRPWFASGVKPYVIRQLRAQLCGRKLADAIAEKATADDKKATAELLKAVRTKAGALLDGTGIATADLNCPAR